MDLSTLNIIKCSAVGFRNISNLRNEVPLKDLSSHLVIIHSTIKFIVKSNSQSITNTKVRKNDSFLDLLERIKNLNSELEKEREFEPHHRSPLAKTMIDNWHNRQKNNLASTNRLINMTDIKK